jgi:hypothetical protein
MKPRVAALLAAFGWYLMVPPMNPVTKTYNPEAPLREWHIFGCYDRAEECRSDQKEQLNFWLENKFGSEAQATRRRTLQGLEYSNCISTDDPRLTK